MIEDKARNMPDFIGTGKGFLLGTVIVHEDQQVIVIPNS